jgi:hypothetical protein
VLEKDLALAFQEMLADFPILVTVNYAQRGWPDRLVQLPNSRIAFVELKIIKPDKQNYFDLKEFKAEQAAFFTKWARRDGLCCLVFASEPERYHVIACEFWRQWLSINKVKLTPGACVLWNADRGKFIDWWMNWTAA